MTQVDVTVIIPVYNTMPYLTATLDSLVRQTLGLDRMQVVAVDDGSTDGSGEELDRYAEKHPDTFVVVHQPNSGGPAEPCNRGLELAEGRYVFFLGADDYLGDEALERLVAKADEWGSDVIFGRMEGVGDRVVFQGVFKETDPDLDLVDSPLAFALSNTKLFRRELLVRNGVHYARDLRVGSDQPFTIEAMLHARRVSVLADYTYYYAVKRDDASNISYSSSWQQRAADIGDIMHHVADVLPPGAERDAFLRRHFAWELTKMFRQDFALVDEQEQAAMAATVAALADTYLTDPILPRLTPESRVMLRLAQAGDVDTLREVVASREHAATRQLALDGDRAYSVLPGFRDHRGLPDAWFELTEPPGRGQVAGNLALGRVRVAGDRLLLDGTVGFTADSAARLRVSLQEVPDGERVPGHRTLERYDGPPTVDTPVTLTDAGPGEPTGFHAEVDLRPLTATSARRWSVRLRADIGGSTYDLALPFTGKPRAAEVRTGLRAARVTARSSRRDSLVLVREPLPPTHVARRALRRVTRK